MCLESYHLPLIFSQQKIFIEYIMLDGVNDEEEHAHQLGKLLDTFQVVSSYPSLSYVSVSVDSISK